MDRMTRGFDLILVALHILVPFLSPGALFYVGSYGPHHNSVWFVQLGFRCQNRVQPLAVDIGANRFDRACITCLLYSITSSRDTCRCFILKLICLEQSVSPGRVELTILPSVRSTPAIRCRRQWGQMSDILEDILLLLAVKIQDFSAIISLKIKKKSLRISM